MEYKLKTDRNLVVRLLSIPAMSRPLERQNRYTCCGMAGLRAVPMVAVFQTPLIRQTGLPFSWPDHSLCSSHQLQQR